MMALRYMLALSWRPLAGEHAGVLHGLDRGVRDVGEGGEGGLEAVGALKVDE
eukprot:CAMPEP_0181263206 /NCGR_PEP_ID=MMETSP1097-20121128/2457_1 /TAXON_ID=35684 /ORGANISM="Pseudopedinella elastica, Strain CCMP716" /LENGTH=51 /DNA_ID=CAMNT_0023361979 /DNA_START=116 /DNA_END=268 /DNA_ORIENTATION=-